MGIYFFLILLTFLSFLYFFKRPSNIGYNIIFALIASVICCGYMCGSDWRVYEYLYNSYTGLGEFGWHFLFVEPLYLLLNIIGNELHLDFWIFYLIIRFIIYVKIVQVFKKYCPKEILMLAFTFYLGFWGLSNFIDPSFRNMIAVYFFLCSIDSLKNRNFKRYLMWVIIATLFHYSAIALLLLYIVVNREYSTKTIILFFVIANVLLIKPEFLFKAASMTLSFIPAIAHKIENYTLGEEAATMGQGKLLSMGYLIHITLFIVILFFRNRIESMKDGRLIFNMSVLFIFIFRIGLTALIFSRFQLYIAYFYSISVAYILYSFVKRDRFIFASVILIFSLASTWNQMRNVYMVPYTNYFLYVGKNISYDERCNYNFINSPYRDIRK